MNYLMMSFALLPLIAFAADDKKEDGETKKEGSYARKKIEGPAFAFVCLNDNKAADEKAWKKSLKKWMKLKSEDEIKEFEIKKDGKRKGETSTASFEIGDHVFVVGMMGAPVPKKDIDYACRNSFLWPEAEEKMEKHKSHMIVMSLGDYDTPVARGLALSRVMAAATECHNTAGVYWGHAAIVHSPEMFRKLIDGAGEKIEDVPMVAWVGFLREPGDKKGTVNFYTRGLSEFGAKELEIINSKKKPSEIFEFLSGLSTYLVVKGDVIKDGDTVGGTEDEKVETEWADSTIDLEGKVIRIDF